MQVQGQFRPGISRTDIHKWVGQECPIPYPIKHIMRWFLKQLGGFSVNTWLTEAGYDVGISHLHREDFSCPASTLDRCLCRSIYILQLVSDLHIPRFKPWQQKDLKREWIHYKVLLQLAIFEGRDWNCPLLTVQSPLCPLQLAIFEGRDWNKIAYSPAVRWRSCN